MKKKKSTAYSLFEEVTAIIRYQITGDEKAKQLLFEQYSNLVHMQAHKALKRSEKSRVSLDDLVSEGFIGLLNAMKKHNVFRCDKMYPTASLYIREAINCYVMDSLTMTRKLSTNSNGRKMFNQYGKKLKELGLELPLTHDQRILMSEAVGVPIRDIEFMENHYSRDVSTDDDENGIISIRSEHDHETVEKDLDDLRLLSVIKSKFLYSLSDKEQDIAMRRILTDEAENAKEIADEYGVSTSSIYQMEKRVSEKLISMAQKEMKINVGKAA